MPEAFFPILVAAQGGVLVPVLIAVFVTLIVTAIVAIVVSLKILVPLRMKEYEAESVCREFCGFLVYQYDPSEYLEQYDEGKEVPGKENQVFIMNALNILIGYWDKAEE